MNHSVENSENEEFLSPDSTNLPDHCSNSNVIPADDGNLTSVETTLSLSDQAFISYLETLTNLSKVVLTKAFNLYLKFIGRTHVEQLTSEQEKCIAEELGADQNTLIEILFQIEQFMNTSSANSIIPTDNQNNFTEQTDTESMQSAHGKIPETHFLSLPAGFDFFQWKLQFEYDAILEKIFHHKLEIPTTISKFLRLLIKIVKNIFENPLDAKYRHITIDLEKHGYILDFLNEAIDIFSSLGFEIYSAHDASINNEANNNISTQLNFYNTPPIIKFYNQMLNDDNFLKNMKFAIQFLESALSSWSILPKFNTVGIQESEPFSKEHISLTTKELTKQIPIRRPPCFPHQLPLPNKAIPTSTLNNFTQKHYSSYAPLRNIHSSKLNEQLQATREMSQINYLKHIEAKTIKNKKFMLRGMNESETKQFLLSDGLDFNSGTNNNSHSTSSNNLGRKNYMDLSAFDKPIMEWKPEKCFFYYSSQFKNQSQFTNINSLSLLRELTHNYEYVGRLALDYTNHYRSINNLHRLIWNRDLMIIGQKHSKEMANGISPIGHKGVEGRFSLYPGFSKLKGENVAAVSSSHQISYQAVNSWINSPGHEKNLRRDFSICGIGVWSHNNMFFLTQMLG